MPFIGYIFSILSIVYCLGAAAHTAAVNIKYFYSSINNNCSNLSLKYSRIGIIKKKGAEYEEDETYMHKIKLIRFRHSVQTIILQPQIVKEDDEKMEIIFLLFFYHHFILSVISISRSNYLLTKSDLGF